MRRMPVVLWVCLLAVASAAADGPVAPPARPANADADPRTGEGPKARKVLTQAYEEAKKKGDPATLARAALDLSAACGAAGDIDEALRLGAEALALFEKQGNDLGAAAALNNLGNLRNARGEFVEARVKHEAALARWRAAKNQAGIAIGLGNLGNDAAKAGHYSLALDYDEQSLALRQAMGDKAGIASVLASLAKVYEALGERPKALEFAKRALATAEDGGDQAAVAEILGQIGSFEHAQGDFEDAIAHFQRELEIVEKSGNQAEVAVVFSNLGTVKYSQGEMEKSREFLEKALALDTKLGLFSAAIHARCNLGVVLLRLGHKEEAAAALEAAVAESDLLKADEDLAYALGLLAGLRQAAGDFAAALSAARRGAEVDARLVVGLGDEEGAFAREAHHGILEAGLDAAVAMSDVREAARFLELGRAGALREALEGRRRGSSAAVPPDLAATEDAARAAETKAIAAYRAALEGGDRAATRARREEADAATAAVEAAIDKIERAAKRGASLGPPRTEDVDGLQARLGPSEAFITYSFHGAQTLAFIVTPKSAQFVGLGKVEAVTKDCEDLHADDPEGPAEEMADALKRIGGHLVRRFRLPDEVKRIYVSPEGATGYVPFTLLFPGREIVYEPSFSTYAMLLDETRTKGDKILALGDPDYSARPAGGAQENPTSPPPEPAERVTRDARGARLVQLPATRGEAKAIGDSVLLGADASEAGLRAAIAAHSGRFRAIHFACHGLLDPDHPARCALALTPSGKDDGFLTARELLGTPIPADLVVLSACETAKGHVLRGEGILGLTRAFMVAGAPRVLCSLWKVDDEATRALMLEFYKRWKSGAPPAAALLAAQASIRAQERWKHPYYWAAWVLWGLPE